MKSISVIDKKVKLYKRSRSNDWQAAIKLQEWQVGTLSALALMMKHEAKEKALKLFYGAES